MARKPVTMAIAEEDLLKLDEFRKPRRLDRGDAVGMLLELLGEGDIQASSSMNSLIDRVSLENIQAAAGNPRLAEARDVLARAEAGENKGALRLEKKEIPEDDAPGYPGSPAEKPKKRDPMDQSSEFEDVDQTWKRR